MIPKKIHYCWFGRGPLPKSAKKCIASWKKFFPDYEIIEWNEDNYSVDKIPYVRQAYEAKKYAFVSDYARFDILYHEGGIYFDTDVEVIKPFDDILTKGAFMGCEIDGVDPRKRIGACECEEKIIARDGAEQRIAVNPGVGMAATPGIQLYKEVLDYYTTQQFLNMDGSLNTETIVTKTTNLLMHKGLKDAKEIQTIDEINIYPKEYFNPLNNNTGKLEKTNNTHSIHWYSMSWITPMGRLKSKFTRPIHRIFGEGCFHRRKKG